MDQAHDSGGPNGSFPSSSPGGAGRGGSGRRAALAAAACALALVGTTALAGPGEEGPPAAAATLPAPAAVSARIDALMEAAWKEQGVEPAAPAPDAELLRRLYLDTTGAIPPEEVVREFLADPSPGRRVAAIQRVLGGAGFARFTALRWSVVLVGREFLTRNAGAAALRRMQGMQATDEGAMEEALAGDEPDLDGPVSPLTAWLEERIAAGAPWDQVARELIAAEGEADTNGAVHFALRHVREGKAEEVAGSAMRVFQGLQIQCAQCHDHPYTEWTQRDFYGVAAFFARTAVRRRPDPDRPGKKGPFEVYEKPDGQVRIPAPEGQHQALVLPRFLTGAVIDPGRRVNRRAELARLVTAPDNPWFARAVANRTWSFYLGRGIVEPVDDLEQTEVALPAVLDLLADDFRQSGYDLRRLTEIVLRTRAYQLGSAGPLEGRDAQLELFARAPLRALTAEQVFYSVLRASGSADIEAEGRQRQRLERLKLQLLRRFLQTFGDDEGEEVVEEGTIPQALMLLNGPLTNDAIRPRPDHPLYRRLFRLGAPERVEVLYLRTLGRPPAADELATALAYLERPEHRVAAGQAQAVSDLLWALLNSSEFGLNH